MSPIADAASRRLAPAAISFDRTVGWITAASISIPLLLTMLIVALLASFSVWIWGAVAALWLALTSWLVWLAVVWPARSYEATSYRVDDTGIEIRRGVYFRAVIAVPRSRVQHIDVLQGPLRRKYGLATLVIYTAGTLHSAVTLAGLSHETALHLRDSLLPETTSDGI